MDYSKIKKVIEFIVKILNFVSGLIGNGKSTTSYTDIVQDSQTNKSTRSKVNEIIRKKLKNA